MKFLKNNKEAGFIALMSAIVISAILLLLASASSFSGFFSRFNTLDYELKETSSALAEACADTALLKLARDSGYNPIDENVNLSDGNCFIKNIANFGVDKLITIQAIYKNSYTNLKISVSPSTMTINSWEETPAP